MRSRSDIRSEKIQNFPSCQIKTGLKQVFNNLLGNAMKFINEGYIELGYVLKDDHVRFHVKDSGIGITPENQKLIFERFRQEDNSYTRKHGGTGLGLAISKQIVELLGGEIGVESKPDQGADLLFYTAAGPNSQTHAFRSKS